MFRMELKRKTLRAKIKTWTVTYEYERMAGHEVETGGGWWDAPSVHPGRNLHHKWILEYN